jgi:hypothetical protein
MAWERLAERIPLRVLTWACVLFLLAFVVLTLVVLIAIVRGLSFEIAGLPFGRDKPTITELGDIRGVVVAFDREQGCPESGWEFFEDAGGRFIAGAGPHNNQDAKGQSIPVLNPKSMAGSIQISITSENLPPHLTHISFSTFSRFERRGGGTALTGASPSSAGRNDPQAINIIPPYVALVFCKYTGMPRTD